MARKMPPIGGDKAMPMKGMPMKGMPMKGMPMKAMPKVKRKGK
jgi:hypothetical protein